MNETLLRRSFTPDLEVRSGGDGRTVRGYAVPYGVPVRIHSDLTEQFARGAFNHQLKAPNRVKFGREHPFMGGSVIGKATLLKDEARGLYGEWRVSATPAGDETLELVKDGVLDELSIGFRERQNRILDDGTIERVTADLIETSVVFAGAYGRDAVITGTRSESLCPECAARAAERVSLPALPADAPPAETRSRLEEARQLLARVPALPI